MLKKLLYLSAAFLLALQVNAQVADTTQDSEPEIILGRNNPAYQGNKGPYVKNNNELHSLAEKKWFGGGGLNLGFGSGGSNIGLMPMVGYSIDDYWDVAMLVNYNYSSFSKNYSYSGLKETNSSLGLGPLVRFFLVKFLFLQGQFEQDWGNYKQGTSSFSYNSQSLIGSIGYANRISHTAGYFFSVGMDFLNNQYSPYRNYDYTDENGKVHTKAFPIIRAGMSFYLW